MTGFIALCLLLALPATAGAASFRAELVKPGETQASQLRSLLGEPLEVMHEGPKREYFFYDLGEGSTMDATILVKSGVVEYVTYLCNETINEVRSKYKHAPSITRTLHESGLGYRGALTQLLYPDVGRGYIYEPKTKIVRACVAWEPGTKFEDL